MEIAKKQIEDVFIAWNKKVLENESQFNMEAVTEENVESYSKDQAEYFVKVFEELNGHGLR